MPGIRHSEKTPVVEARCRYCGEASTYLDIPSPPLFPPSFCRNGGDAWMYCATQRIGLVRWLYAADLFDDG
jgi:hypothetical protein